MIGQTPRSRAIGRTKAENSHVVYIVREGDEIVYIGRTVNLLRRMKQHAISAGWYSDTITVETEEYADYHEAHTRERSLIWNYRPRGNRQCNPDYHGNCVTAEGDPGPSRRERREAALRAVREARSS